MQSEFITANPKPQEYHPQSAEYYQQMGDHFVQDQQWNQAITAYQQVLKLNPNFPSIYKKLANTLQLQIQEERSTLKNIYRQKIQEYPSCLENYRLALELQPNDAELYLNLGKRFMQKGDWERGILAYHKFLYLQPQHPQADLLLASGFNPQSLTSTPLFEPKFNLNQAKATLENCSKIALENFLKTQELLHFPSVYNPELSIIILLHNRAELTFKCLSSLVHQNFKSFELILIDNASQDATIDLLQRIQGAKIVRNQNNLNFVIGCNQGSKIAQGKYLLFLNNDAEILGNGIEIAINTIKSSSEIGAVGGKLILPDGTLQEAGGIIWQDGSCSSYGRTDSPNAPQYQFQRFVDYCSAAFFLTPRALFLKLGGFDQDYQPAYYEEIDYCIRLQKIGKKIIYDPNILVLHYEFASSSYSDSSEYAMTLMEKNKTILRQKHQDWFLTQYPFEPQNILLARFQNREKHQRILYLDVPAPHPQLNFNTRRSYQVICNLVNLGSQVTLYPIDFFTTEDEPTFYADLPPTIEMMRGYGLVLLEDFLRERQGYYHQVLVSYPHNIKHLNSILAQENLLKFTQIIEM